MERISMSPDAMTPGAMAPRAFLSDRGACLWRVSMQLLLLAADGTPNGFPLSASWDGYATSSTDATMKGMAWMRETHQATQALNPEHNKIRVLEVLQVGV